MAAGPTAAATGEGTAAAAIVESAGTAAAARATPQTSRSDSTTRSLIAV